MKKYDVVYNYNPYEEDDDWVNVVLASFDTEEEAMRYAKAKAAEDEYEDYSVIDNEADLDHNQLWCSLDEE